MTNQPRLRKILRDVWENKARTGLVVLALTVGLAGLGAFLVSYAVLMREMQVNYLATNPASATVAMEAVTPELVSAVRALPQIADAEARGKVVGRIEVKEGQWLPLWLFVVDDFGDLRVSTFRPQAGAWPPATGEILLERNALGVAQKQIGNLALVKTPHGTPQTLRVAGIVHDPGQAPAWMEGLVYGYITRETLAQLGEPPVLTELKLTVAEQATDRAYSVSVVEQLKPWLAARGYTVSRTEVPVPGAHPHASQMAALLYVEEAFGLLALVLSAVLTANMIEALMAQQIRQIGVLKAVGATPWQVMGIYFGVAGLLGGLALLLALPLAVMLGLGYAAFAANALNFDLTSTAIPLWVFGVQTLLAVGLPVAVAAWPVYRGSRLTVREAMSDYGLAATAAASGWGEGLSALALKVFSRPMWLSLRNTFRRQGRLALTLGVLVAGGAIFIAAVNVRASMLNTVEAMFSALRYDTRVVLAQPYPAAQVEQAVRAVPGVATVEVGEALYATRVSADGHDDRTFALAALAPESRALNLPVVAGRWLQAGDTQAVVINSTLAGLMPEVKVGDTLTLTVGGQRLPWQVVGLVRQAVGAPTAYVSYPYLAQQLGQAGYANAALVTVQDQSPAGVTAVKRVLEKDLAQAGLNVTANESKYDFRKIVEDHLNIIATFLMLTALLIVAVGGLGLATTMSINVLERTREIGVLRAVGASTSDLLQIIVTEGLLIGLMSWGLAALIAPPLSAVIGNAMGNIFFASALDTVVDPLGPALWLGLVLVFALLASLYPALRAARLTVREVLAYE